MLVYLMVALVCGTAGCRDLLPAAPPLSFSSLHACVAAASEAAKQGATETCRVGYAI